MLVVNACSCVCGCVLLTCACLCVYTLDHRRKQQGRLPLAEAALNGHEDVVRYLLQAGADVNGANAVSRNCRIQRVSLSATRLIVLSCRQPETAPVTCAVWHGSLPLLAYLVEEGADISMSNNVSCNPHGAAE